MNIAIVSKLWEPTSPESTGGTGAAVGNLVVELRKRGHQVKLFATSDSLPGPDLISSISSTDFRQHYSETKEFANIAAAFDQRQKFDIIHCHNEYKSLFWGAASDRPSLHTVRYGEFFIDEQTVFNNYQHLNFVAISQAIKKMLPALNWQGLVYNGISPELFPFQENKSDYFLFLARLSPQKGPDIAINIARRLNKKLILAGKRTDHDSDYLQKKVDPFIDGQQIKYVGEVGFKEKIELLSQAICLLHPISIYEAFGMTLIEAMICGTPVIAFNQGAIPEVIVQGKTGFIVETEDEMMQAIKKLSEISAHDCRQRVVENFSVASMADGYEEIYRKIIS